MNKNTVHKTLLLMGVPSHIKGKTYLEEGLVHMLDDLGYVPKMHSYLYPYIANKFGTHENCVERCIRNAIGISMTKISGTLLQEVFGNTVDLDNLHATNGHYIASIYDYILHYIA